MEFFRPDSLIDRRQCLRLIGAGSVGILGGGLLRFSGRVAAAAESFGPSADFSPDLDVELTATTGKAPLLPGRPTDVWQFRGRVLEGDPAAVVQDEQSYLGPSFNVRKGQKIRVRLRNDISQRTVVHWHGLKVNDRADGHPRFSFAPGDSFVSEFEVINRAGTYWYHPHPHGLTGPQVYGGLAGLFYVSDPAEEALKLPSGEYDMPLVIQDRRFDAQNQLVYIQHPMDRMNGFLGDRILVNGRVDAVFPVASGAYRLRLLNGSNSRIYRLAWDDGRPLIIIGTDGGLLEEPVRLPAVMLGPGERLDIWGDFSRDPQGSRPSLVSLPFDIGGMGGGMMGRGRMMRGLAAAGDMPLGAPFKICAFEVNRPAGETRALPERLTPLALPHAAEAVNYGDPKPFFLEMRRMQWTINGRTFQMTAVAPDEQVRFGTTEIWDFVNRGGGGGMMGMMQMPHPMHLHGVQFRILERIGGPDYEFFDEGWQDTTLVWPGQTVRILVPFEAHSGLFLYHCHNLEHEDQGMMRNFEIQI